MQTKDLGRTQETLLQQVETDHLPGKEALAPEEFLRINHGKLLKMGSNMARYLKLSVEDAEDAIQTAIQSLPAEPFFSSKELSYLIRQKVRSALLDLKRRESRRARIANTWQLDVLRAQPHQPELVRNRQSLRSYEEGLNPEDRDSVDLAIQSTEQALASKELVEIFGSYLRSDSEKLTLHTLFLHEVFGYEWSEIQEMIGWRGPLGTLRKRAHALRQRLKKVVADLVSTGR